MNSGIPGLLFSFLLFTTTVSLLTYSIGRANGDSDAAKKVLQGYKVTADYKTNELNEVSIVKINWVK